MFLTAVLFALSLIDYHFLSNGKKHGMKMNAGVNFKCELTCRNVAYFFLG